MPSDIEARTSRIWPHVDGLHAGERREHEDEADDGAEQAQPEHRLGDEEADRLSVEQLLSSNALSSSVWSSRPARSRAFTIRSRTWGAEQPSGQRLALASAHAHRLAVERERARRGGDLLRADARAV